MTKPSITAVSCDLPETGAPEITCPFCRRSWEVDEAVRKTIIAELRSWDRRFDSPQAMMDTILGLLQGNELCTER